LNLDTLKRETAADHQAVEGTIPLMTPGLSRQEYIDCLLEIYGVVAAWEDQAATTSPDWLRSVLKDRQRKQMLEQDLASFGILKPGSARPTLPPINDESSLLGVMYVMEGSTLGGQLIARHVAAELALTHGQGDAYFRGHGPQTGAMWKEFCHILETRVPESETDVVIQSAKAMFQVFGQWMQRGAR
jgi:heme oxygenase